MPQKNGSTPHAPLSAELTRLHRLTQEEAELIMDFRILSERSKELLKLTTKLHAEGRIEPTGGNIVSIARCP